MNHVMIIGWDTTAGHPVSLPAGTSTIGNVGIVAGTATLGKVELVTGTGNIGSLLAGTGNIGSIVTTDLAGTVKYGAVTTAIQYASFATITSAAAQVVVTSVSAKQLVVMAAVFAGSPAMTLQFFSASTTRSGPMNIVAGGNLTLPYNKDGWLITNAGESFTITPSVSGNCGGMVSYIVV